MDDDAAVMVYFVFSLYYHAVVAINEFVDVINCFNSPINKWKFLFAEKGVCIKDLNER